jgi:hypothetical protein
MEQNDQEAILDKDGGLRIPIHLSTFLTVEYYYYHHPAFC